MTGDVIPMTGEKEEVTVQTVSLVLSKQDKEVLLLALDVTCRKIGEEVNKHGLPASSDGGVKLLAMRGMATRIEALPLK